MYTRAFPTHLACFAIDGQDAVARPFIGMIAKAGTARPPTCLAVAAAPAEKGHAVALVDADPQSTATMIFGLKPVAEPWAAEPIELYLKELGEDRGRERRTLASYQGVHAKWFAPKLGERRLRDLEEEDFVKVFGRMRRAGLSRSRLDDGDFCLSRRWSRCRDPHRR